MVEARKPTTPDLRARNLERNRADVSAVAVELFATHGFQHVTIDDIATAARISKRTFFRYFDTKEDAVLPYEQAQLEQFRSLLARRDPDEPFLANIRRAATMLLTNSEVIDRHDAIARLHLIRDNPSVNARHLELRSRWEHEVRDILADHLGEDPATSITAAVAAAATIGAIRAAAEVWAATEPAADLGNLVERAFELLADGLDSPTARTRH